MNFTHAIISTITLIHVNKNRAKMRIRRSQGIKPRRNEMSLNIMITGTNSGFGKLIVNSLLSKGHTIIATMRQPDGRNQAAAGELANAGATVVEMDVTDEGSIARGLNQALKRPSAYRRADQ